MRIYDRTPSPECAPKRFVDVDFTFFENGALVHFSTAAEELLVVRERGRSAYELVTRAYEPCAAGHYSMDVLPAEALFVVVRQGERVSFSALGAQGKTLRAASSPSEPHSLCSVSFGDAESWKQVGRDFVNIQWEHKRLGFKVHHVTALPTASLAHLEKHYSREIHALEVELTNQAQGAHASASKQSRMTQQQSRQAAEMRLQLESANRAALRWQREAAELQSAVADLKRRLQRQESSAGRDAPGGPRQQSEHAGRLVQLASPQHRQAQASSTSTEYKSKIESLTLELSVSQERLAAAVAQRDAAAAAARAEAETALHNANEHHMRQLQVKDAEICFLLEERNRLDVTLHTIKDMTQLMRQGQTPDLHAAQHAQDRREHPPTALPELSLSSEQGDAAEQCIRTAEAGLQYLEREEQGGDAHELASPEPAAATAGGGLCQAAGILAQHAQRALDDQGQQCSPSVHPVFNPEARSRMNSLYDMLNPFRPSSVIGNNSPEPREPRESDMIRVSQMVAQEPVVAGPGSSCSDGDDSTHRVAHGSTFVVDYTGSRPDAITEQAMQRILDGPLESYPSEGRHVHFNQSSSAAGHLEADAGDAQTPSGTPATRLQVGESAPTSIARTEMSMDGNGRAWGPGSLSLPGSASTKPLAFDIDRLQDRENIAARIMTASAAVKAMEEVSPPAANAVAQFMADQLTMRASMPDGVWMGERRPNRKLQLAENGAKGLRRSAPSRIGAKPEDGSQRAAFLNRPPVNDLCL